MPTQSIYAYSAGVLAYNRATNSFDLAADFDPATGRLLVTIDDDDRYLDGDRSADEVGEDADQVAVISAPDGTLLARGRMYIEAYAEIVDPDGGTIWLDRIEIAGVHYGYFSTRTLVPGVSYPLRLSRDVDDDLDGRGSDTRLTYDQIESIRCFASGTRIATDRGEMPVERIGPGSRVLTRDNGLQPVLWSGTSPVSRADMVAGPHRCPVIVGPGSLDPGVPRRTLVVSRQHRILLAGPACELLFGVPEVFAAAGHLAGRMAGIGIARASPDLCYHHILLPRHEIVLSDGAWTESFLAAGEGLASLGDDARSALFGDPGQHHATAVARRCLREWEVEALLGRARTCGDRAA